MKDKILVNICTDHAFESETEVIGREGEGYSARFEITIPKELSDCAVYLDFEKPSGEKFRTPKLKVKDRVAVYDPVPYLFTERGEIKVQAVLQNADGETWKSSVKKYNIQYSINAFNDEIPQKEDFMFKAQKVIDVFSQKVAEIAEALLKDKGFAEDVASTFEEFVEEEVATVDRELSGEIAKKLQLSPAFANSISECTDTSKLYVLPDGYIYAYQYWELTGGRTITEKLGGTFKDNTRLSTSSGEEKTLAGFVTSPSIDVSKLPDEFEIELTGIEWVHFNSSGEWEKLDGCAYAVFANSGYSPVFDYTKNRSDSSYCFAVEVITSNRVKFKVYSGFKQRYSSIKFSGCGTSANANITISYKQDSTESGYAWASTGHAFVPTDYGDRVKQIEDSQASIEEKFNTVDDVIQSIGTIPSYVLEEAEIVADKILSVRNANSFVFGAISDLHTTGSDNSAQGIKHAGMGMNEINNLTRLDMYAILGDIVVGKFDESYKSGFKFVKKSFAELSKTVPLVHLQGNHDELSTDTTEQARQKYYSYIGANNVGTVTDYANKFRNYGYRDFDNYKIRVIYLNTVDVSEGEVTSDNFVSDVQLQWLNNVALNIAEAGWGVIILTHHPLNWYGMESLRSALADFKIKQSKVELIAHFHGHLHNFRAEALDGIVTITIPNACFGRNNEYGTSSSYGDDIHGMYGDAIDGAQRLFNKTADSAKDTAFDVVVVDRENRKIHCFNYGAGIDREINY